MPAIRCLPTAAALAALACTTAAPTSPLDHAVTAAVVGPIRLARLQPGDRLEIDAHWWGCFHDSRGRFVLEQGADPTPLLTGTHTAETALRREPRTDASKELPKRLLTAHEVAGLDALLDDYRSVPRLSTCTSQADYRLTLYRAGIAIVEESYHDGSCDDRPTNLVYVWQLVPER